MPGAGDLGPSGAGRPLQPDPDDAWKTLSLVNDWIKHADAKIGVTFAVTGAAGVMLFNVVKDASSPGCVLKVLGALTAVALVASAGLAVAGLVPRLRIRGRRAHEPFTNLLFYKHIACGYEDAPGRYKFALGSLILDPQRLVDQIGEQVHANATVALRKFGWADKAIRALAVGLALLAATAVARVVG